MSEGGARGGGGPFSPSHAQHDLETIGLTLLKAGEFLQRRYGDFQKETTSTTLALAAEGNVVRIQNSKHCINYTGYSICIYVCYVICYEIFGFRIQNVILLNWVFYLHTCLRYVIRCYEHRRKGPSSAVCL